VRLSTGAEGWHGGQDGSRVPSGMDLIVILAATLVAGIGSVWLAALLLRLGVDSRSGGGVGAQHLLSLAAGALLATAFMHLLPEAFQSEAGANELFALLLVGLVFFFLLDKAELWHHGHEHHEAHGGAHGHSHPHPDAHALAHAHSGPVHAHPHAQAKAPDPADQGGHSHAPGRNKAGGWTVLAGDSVHCFGDGILIASAFIADFRLGIVAALSVMAHEVPHHIGDLVVLRHTTGSRRAALIKVTLAGAVTLLGGLTGWWLVGTLSDYLPYFLTVASSSFIYVALADLIPQLQRQLGARATAAQIAWLLSGIGMVTLVSRLAHVH
jgi:zinc and cadmium transporter